MRYLNLVPVTAEQEELGRKMHGVLNFDEFVSRMIKIGFGQKVCQIVWHGFSC